MHDMLVTAVAVFAGLCAWVHPAGAGLLSGTGPVIAILGDDLFVGEAEGRISGSGTVRIQSRAKPEINCRGEFNSSSDVGGEGNLKCSDGAAATFLFERLGLRRGHGRGTSSRGRLTFTYGLNPSESMPYLKPPPGKVLRLGANEIQLVDAGDLRR
jgi:hypothetical protein